MLVLSLPPISMKFVMGDDVHPEHQEDIDGGHVHFGDGRVDDAVYRPPVNSPIGSTLARSRRRRRGVVGQSSTLHTPHMKTAGAPSGGRLSGGTEAASQVKLPTL